MTRIVDDGTSYGTASFNGSIFLSVDRKIYNRLQMIPLSPLGTGAEDSIPPISDFISEMEKFYTVPPTSSTSGYKLDDFFGQLGVDIYYPHPDNTYTGELLNG